MLGGARAAGGAVLTSPARCAPPRPAPAAGAGFAARVARRLVAASRRPDRVAGGGSERGQVWNSLCRGDAYDDDEHAGAQGAGFGRP